MDWVAENSCPGACISGEFSIFGFAEDTSARQCSNKFDIALAYSYLCTLNT